METVKDNNKRGEYNTEKKKEYTIKLDKLYQKVLNSEKKTKLESNERYSKYRSNR